MSKRKIPIIRIALSVIEDLKDKKAILFQRLIALAVIMTAFQTAISTFIDENSFSALLGCWVIYGVLFTLFAVTTHRVIILGPNSVPIYGVHSISMRELRFFGWGFVAYFYLTIVTFIIMLFMGSVFGDEPNEPLWILVVYVAAIPGMYIFSRLSILFPATAVDERKNMIWAWGITEGNGWRLLVILAVLPILIWLVPSLLIGESFLIDVVVTFFGFILTALEIALLSHTYKFLMESDSETVGV